LRDCRLRRCGGKRDREGGTERSLHLRFLSDRTIGLRSLRFKAQRHADAPPNGLFGLGEHIRDRIVPDRAVQRQEATR